MAVVPSADPPMPSTTTLVNACPAPSAKVRIASTVSPPSTSA
jgi:hypothetical protein